MSSSSSYTKKEWGSLSIQERIKAMNRAVEKDEEDLPPEEHVSSPVLQETPKRTSVVEMWRKREKSSGVSTKPAAINKLMSSPSPNKLEVITKQTVKSDSIAHRKEQTFGRQTEIPHSSSKQLLVTTNDNRKLGGSPSVTQTRNSAVSSVGNQNTVNTPLVNTLKLTVKHPSPKQDGACKDSMIIDDDGPPQDQQLETTRLSVVDRWNKRGLTGAPARLTVSSNASELPQQNDHVGDEVSQQNQPSTVADMWNSKRQGSHRWNQRSISSPINTREANVDVRTSDEVEKLQSPAMPVPIVLTNQELRNSHHDVKNASPEWRRNYVASSPSWKNLATKTGLASEELASRSLEKQNRPKIAVDMKTKCEVDTNACLAFDDKESQRSSAVGDDNTLVSENSSVMELWRKRDSLPFQSATPASTPNRNSLFGKPSPLLKTIPKPPQEQLNATAATHGAQKLQRKTVATPSNDCTTANEVALMKSASVASSESTNGAVEWPLADQFETAEHPHFPIFPPTYPVGKTGVLDRWKKRHSGGIVRESNSLSSPMKPASSDTSRKIESSLSVSSQASNTLNLLPRRGHSSDGEAAEREKTSPSRKSNALDLWRKHHTEEMIENDAKAFNGKFLEAEALVMPRPPINSSLMTIGKKHKSGTPTSLAESVKSKKDVEDMDIAGVTSKIRTPTNSLEVERRLGGSALKNLADQKGKKHGSADHKNESKVSRYELGLKSKLLAPVPSGQEITMSSNEGETGTKYRPPQNDSGLTDALATGEGLPEEENEPGQLFTTAKGMGRATNQFSPTRKLSCTAEKKRVQEHRLRLKQGRCSDQSVSSVEDSVASQPLISPNFSNTEPDTQKESTVNSHTKSSSNLAQPDHPYSSPVDYDQPQRFEIDPVSSVTTPDELKRKQTSLPLKIQTGGSAFSSPTNGSGAFSRYSRTKLETSPFNSNPLYSPKTPSNDSSPHISPSISSTSRAFSYRSTNRYKHKQQLAARAKSTPTSAHQQSSMSETGQSDTALSFFSTASSGYSTKSIHMAASAESEESGSVASSALASRASLVLKGRRNKHSPLAPDEERTTKDLTRQIIQGEPAKQQPSHRNETAAYFPSRGNVHTALNGAELNKGQRDGLFSRYNSSSRFTDVSTPRGPQIYNFRDSNSSSHPQKTFSFSSQISENSSHLLSLASSRSEGSDAWMSGGGAQSIKQIHSVSTEGTPSVQVDYADQGYVNEIGNFDELQSVYRDLDLARIALEIREEVQTSFNGSMKEVTDMVSALLAKPLTPSKCIKKPERSRRKAYQDENEDIEEVAIEVQYLGDVDDEDHQSLGGADLPNSSFPSSIEPKYHPTTMYDNNGKSPTTLEGAKRGFV